MGSEHRLSMDGPTADLNKWVCKCSCGRWETSIPKAGPYGRTTAKARIAQAKMAHAKHAKFASTPNTTAPTGVVSSNHLGVISREEWTRRYAARIQERAGWTADEAFAAACVGAEEYERQERGRGKAMVWWGGPSGADNTPEDQADEEMSYWTDDGE